MLRLIDRQVLVDIADAIRHCNESDEKYRPSEMADAIRAISSSSAPIPVYGLFDTHTDAETTARLVAQTDSSLTITEFMFQDTYDITAVVSSG